MDQFGYVWSARDKNFQSLFGLSRIWGYWILGNPKPLINPKPVPHNIWIWETGNELLKKIQGKSTLWLLLHEPKEKPENNLFCITNYKMVWTGKICIPQINIISKNLMYKFKVKFCKYITQLFFTVQSPQIQSNHLISLSK
jgi:hypothetical protein